MRLTPEEQFNRMQEALDTMGGQYSMQDIFDMVKRQEMAWITTDNGDGHCVVAINQYPRKKQLVIIMVFGIMDDNWDEIHAKCVAMGREHSCTEMVMTGRKGWKKVLPNYDWEELPLVSYKLKL